MSPVRPTHLLKSLRRHFLGDSFTLLLTTDNEPELLLSFPSLSPTQLGLFCPRQNFPLGGESRVTKNIPFTRLHGRGDLKDRPDRSSRT